MDQVARASPARRRDRRNPPHAPLHALPRDAVAGVDREGVAVSYVKARIHGLTPWQWAVASAIYEGLSYKEIAQRFGSSERAVKSCSEAIREKWGLRNKSEIILRIIALKSEVSNNIGDSREEDLK